MTARTRQLLLTCLLISALLGLRLVHLGADTPLEAATWSRGIFVDEGYKTLDPLNLARYGSAHWHPEDDYPGWMKASPLTQWPFYAAFRLFGPELESARLVTVGWFLLLLIGYVFAGWRDYDWKLLLLGVWLLGTAHTLFFFSRLAMLEVPVAVFCYGLLFVVRGSGVRRPWQLFALAAVLSVVAVVFVKRTALLYMLPIMAGLLVTLDFRQQSALRSVLLALGLATPVGALVYSTSGLWSRGLQTDLPALASSLFANQALESSALLMGLGLVCSAHLVMADTGSLRRSPYLASLVALVVGGPLALAFLVKEPLRYFVPVLPACVLLAVEWVHLRAWERKIPQRLPWYAWVVSLWILVFATFALAQAVNKHILFVLPLPLGDSPGLTNAAMFKLVAPLSVLSALIVLAWRSSFFETKRIRRVVAFLVVLVCARDVYVLARFLVSPSYRSVEVAREIAELLPPEAVVAGDYAPFFAARGGFKALYLDRSFNRPDRIAETRPDFLLFTDTTEMFAVRDALLANPQVEVGEPVYESRYADRVVELYPLSYSAEAGAAGSSGSPGRSRDVTAGGTRAAAAGPA